MRKAVVAILVMIFAMPAFAQQPIDVQPPPSENLPPSNGCVSQIPGECIGNLPWEPPSGSIGIDQEPPEVNEMRAIIRDLNEQVEIE